MQRADLGKGGFGWKKKKKDEGIAYKLLGGIEDEIVIMRIFDESIQYI